MVLEMHGLGHNGQSSVIKTINAQVAQLPSLATGVVFQGVTVAFYC
jgi:hypothetical protein